MENVFEKPTEAKQVSATQVKEKKKTKKELTEEKRKELTERLVKAREILKQNKEKRKEQNISIASKVIESKPAPAPTPETETPKYVAKPKKQVLIKEETSSDSSDEEIVVVKKKKEQKSKMNDEKLDAIHNALNELVSYKKTKIEAKNNYLKYHETKLKQGVEQKSLVEEKPKQPEPPKQEPPKVATPQPEPPEIELPSFRSLSNNRFNKRGF